MARPELGHLRIEIVERKPLLRRTYWFWRTRNIENGQTGVTSETYPERRDVERSIRAHRRYVASAEVWHVRPDGRRVRVEDWTRDLSAIGEG